MMRNLFNETLYVKVFKNRFQIRHVERKIEIQSSALEPFTTTRLLIGEFTKSQQVLKAGLKKILSGRWYSPAPKIVIHPMEMVDGGLSEIEARILREVAMSAGARKVVVWVGHELSDHEILGKL